MDGAVEELQYVNGGVDTPMGKWRAENGHAQAYNVHWWGIGNEMYGGWQLGHMSLEEYVKKHNEFAEAMRAEDRSIKLVAVGKTGTSALTTTIDINSSRKSSSIWMSAGSL